MISLGIDDFFALCATVLCLTLGVLWGRQRWLARNHAWELSTELLCRCRKCSYTFMVQRNETVTRCPACEELNRPRLRRKKSKRIRYE